MHAQVSKNEYVSASCCMLAISAPTVLKLVKEKRKQAFESRTPGFEMGMKECPNCGQMGLFVHDGNLAKCVHPDHDSICEAINQKKKEEAEQAERNRTKTRDRKCTRCACRGMFRPGEFKLTDDAEKAPSRCARHICLSVDNMEIACGGQCDGCMQVFCTRCHRCKCYKYVTNPRIHSLTYTATYSPAHILRCSYSTRRCPSCVEAHTNWDTDAPIPCPPLYPLSMAFPSSKEKLVLCNICRAKRVLRTREVCTFINTT